MRVIYLKGSISTLFIYSCSSQNSSISLIALKKKGLHAGHKTLQLYALKMQLLFLPDSALRLEFLPRSLWPKGFQNLGNIIIIVSEAFVFTSLSSFHSSKSSCLFLLFCHKSNTILCGLVDSPCCLKLSSQLTNWKHSEWVTQNNCASTIRLKMSWL